MNARSRTCCQANWWDSPNAISSPASADGPLPCDSPAGPTIAPCGPDPARASLSARQAKALGLLTSGTSGRRGITSSASAALASSLASRLQAVTDLHGSIWYTLTWKQRATPAGLSITALRASRRRTSDSDCGSWPTTTTTDALRVPSPDFTTKNITLNHAALLAGWGTPTATEPGGSPQRFQARKLEKVGGDAVTMLAHQAAWATPCRRDYRCANLTPYKARGGA